MVGQSSMLTGIVLLVLAQGLAGCGDTRSSWAPTPVPQPVSQPSPIKVVVFTDPVSGFSTSNVRDVQEQIVQFNTAGELIWTADGTRFPGYPVNGNVVLADRVFPWCRPQVHFGTKGGERRAYLLWGDDYNHYYPGTVVDIEVVGGQLVITETKVPVPGT